VPRCIRCWDAVTAGEEIADDLAAASPLPAATPSWIRRTSPPWDGSGMRRPGRVVRRAHTASPPQTPDRRITRRPPQLTPTRQEPGRPVTVASATPNTTFVDLNLNFLIDLSGTIASFASLSAIVSGMSQAPAGKEGSSSTGPPKKSAPSRFRQPSPSCSASTSPSTARHSTGGYSVARAAASSPTPGAGARGIKQGAPLSARPRQHHRSPNDPTTCGTPACPPGSTQASHPRRSPSGRATASPSCFASTPNASPTPRRPPSNASKKQQQGRRQAEVRMDSPRRCKRRLRIA
jgi:hypothetical protein